MRQNSPAALEMPQRTLRSLDARLTASVTGEV
jgi:hypothetical protein